MGELEQFLQIWHQKHAIANTAAYELLPPQFVIAPSAILKDGGLPIFAIEQNNITQQITEYAVRRTTLKPFLLTFWGSTKSTSLAGAKPGDVDLEFGFRIDARGM